MIISNCVVNLSPDKDAVLREAFRVLKPGGRFAISDVVVRGEVPAEIRRSMELWIGCIAGALEESEYRAKLARAGFEAIDVEATHVYTPEKIRHSIANASDQERDPRRAPGRARSTGGVVEGVELAAASLDPLLVTGVRRRVGCAPFAIIESALAIRAMAGGLVLLAAMTVTDIAQAAETAVEPTPAQAHLSRGQELIARGDLAAAATALREALRLDPELVQARSSLGLALYGMGDLDGAVDELRGLLRRHPHVLPARLHLASALMARQDWAGARSELEEVLRRQRDLPQAHYSLAVVRYTVGDLPGAVDSYRQVLALDPGHHDARYGLGLMLKLARRDAEAATELLAAAQGGHARAQYFLGNAYAGGLGVERNLPRAIAWWFAASEAGVAPAEEALAQLRQVATGRGRRGPVERPAVEQAFREFRAELWQGFPDLARDGDDSVGATLVRAGRAREGVPLLIREAGTLSEPAQRMLETLYERGVEGQLEPYDPRILSYLRTAAAEGQVRPRIALARIYGAGLGVPKDVAQAVSLLRATPHEDAQLLLQELSGSR